MYLSLECWCPGALKEVYCQEKARYCLNLDTPSEQWKATYSALHIQLPCGPQDSSHDTSTIFAGPCTIKLMAVSNTERELTLCLLQNEC